MPPSRTLRYRQPAPPRRRDRLTGIVILAAVILAGFQLQRGPAPQPAASGAAVTVVDGDSLRIGDTAIRLIGIDAPELHQTCRDAARRAWACGAAAHERLAALVAQGKVRCEARGRDRYGRTLATCAVGDIPDIGERLVREGLAVNYDLDSGYPAAEHEARRAGRGLWQGAFERPQDWRRSHKRSS